MSTPSKSITLRYPEMNRNPMIDPRLPENKGIAQVYGIVKVTNSVEFDPGDQLTRTQVDELCRNKDWRVLVVGMLA